MKPEHLTSIYMHKYIFLDITTFFPLTGLTVAIVSDNEKRNLI